MRALPLLVPACLLLLVPHATANCSAAAPCKILALHGGGGTAYSFEYNTADLAARLGSAFTFVYASIGSPSTQETWWDDPTSKSQATTDPNQDAAMVAALNTVRANQGPFWGLIGYSQGAAAVPVYLASVPNGTFQAAAMFCGYLTTTHTGLLNRVNAKAPFGDISALNWFSTADRTITPAMSRELSPKFTSPTVIEANPGPGHLPPRCGDATFDQVVTWFQTTGGASNTTSTCVSGATGATGAATTGLGAGAIAGIAAGALVIIAVAAYLCGAFGGGGADITPLANNGAAKTSDPPAAQGV